MNAVNPGLRWWLRRDSGPAGQSAAQASWDSWRAPHRREILETLDLLAPFDSLYEVGCQAGPNLRLIQNSHPGVRLGGSEPCPMAASWAFQQLGCRIDATALPDMAPGAEADIVLSCYTLAYLAPDEIGAALRNMAAAARRAIILLEPMAWGGFAACQCRAEPLVEWRHQYHELIADIGWRIAWAWPIMAPVQNANAILIATAEHRT